MVSDQDLQAQSLRLRNTFHAGDAVVDGDQNIGTRLLYSICNGGGQAVAIDHAVGHEVADMLCSKHAKTPHAHCTCCGAVAIVISHDAKALVGGNGICQQAGCFL